MSNWTVLAIALITFAFGVYCKEQNDEAAVFGAMFFLFVAAIILTVRLTIFFA